MWWQTLKAGMSRPDVWLEHLGAYRALAQAEGQDWLAHQRRRAMWIALAAAGALGTLFTTALSLVAVAMQSPADMHAPWLLVVVPALPTLLLVVALWQLNQNDRPVPFTLTREQLALDAQWLRDKVQP